MRLFKGPATALSLSVGAIALAARLSPQTVQQVFSLLVTNESGQSQHYTVVAGSTHDGDSLRVNDGVLETKVILCGVDAPELEKPLGIQSRDHLQELIAQGNGRITLVKTGIDKHGRTIADAFIRIGGEAEIHLNSQMLSDGMAYVYSEYVSVCPDAAVMQKAERIARDGVIDVWANPTALKPWDYRQRKGSIRTDIAKPH